MALADDNTVMDFESKYLQLSGVSECPWQLSSLQKKKRRQLPPRASHYSYATAVNHCKSFRRYKSLADAN